MSPHTHRGTTAQCWQVNLINFTTLVIRKAMTELTQGHQSHGLGVAHTRGVLRESSVGHLTDQEGHSACRDV